MRRSDPKIPFKIPNDPHFPQDRSPGTRYLLRQHKDDLLRRLDDQLPIYLNTIADALECLIKWELGNAPELAGAFVTGIPIARKGCPQPKDLESYANILAYAFVHFIDRYLRVWEILRQLVCVAALPSPSHLAVLDIGSGPASALYATSDFYQVVSGFGRANGIGRLARCQFEPCPIEQCRGMCHFFHVLSEVAKRPGPFGPIKGGLTGFDPTELRRRAVHNETRKFYDEDEWSAFMTDGEILAWANELHRYHLVFLNYFLTNSGSLQKHENGIIAALAQQRQGGIVVVMSGTKDEYPAIYERFAEIAARSGHTPIRDIPTVIDDASRRPFFPIMKKMQCTIWRDLSDRGILERHELEGYPPYGDPDAPIDNLRPFGLRVFRKMRRGLSVTPCKGSVMV